MQFIGPSYQLESRPASVQRTINMVPVPLEPGNERTPWVFKDVPGLVSAVSSWQAGPVVVTATVDWTLMTPGYGPGRPPQPVSMFGGMTNATFEANQLAWLGPTEPNCPFGTFPAIVGCLEGVNMLVLTSQLNSGFSEVLDPPSPTFGEGATIQSVQMDFTMQIRSTTDELTARFDFRNGLELMRIELFFLRSPLTEVIRVWPFGSDVDDFPLIEEPLTYISGFTGNIAQKVRVDFGGPAGGANENTLRLFRWTGSAWVVIGSLTYPGPVVVAPETTGPVLPRFRVYPFTLAGNAGLFNVERVMLLPWVS